MVQIQFIILLHDTKLCNEIFVPSFLTEYSKRNITEKAWKEVAEEVNDTVSNCRERWRNIRGSFLRSLRKPPSGSGSNAKKKYYLTNYLEFILPYTKSKPCTGNLETLLDSDDNSVEGNSNSQENTEKQDPPCQSQDDEISKDVNVPNLQSDITTNQNVRETSEEASAKYTNTAKKRKETQIPSSAPNPVDSDFVEWLQNKKEMDDFKKEDANMSFFRSLLPDVRKMTDKQSRRFRQKVIGLVDEILDDADIRSCSSQSWSTNNARTSAEPYAVACSTPNPNEWPIEEQKYEMSDRLLQDQNNLRDELKPCYNKY
ncbi:hypothetical protein JTB14_025386 [Gonioctena quinquepunctata]|nr:hypothetical protein JTB14_025386 [Gonioctena quinquepunctata]